MRRKIIRRGKQSGNSGIEGEPGGAEKRPGDGDSEIIIGSEAGGAAEPIEPASIAAELGSAAPVSEPGTEEKRGRGRPKGSRAKTASLDLDSIAFTLSLANAMIEAASPGTNITAQETKNMAEATARFARAHNIVVDEKTAAKWALAGAFLPVYGRAVINWSRLKREARANAPKGPASLHQFRPRATAPGAEAPEPTPAQAPKEPAPINPANQTPPAATFTGDAPGRGPKNVN